MPSVQIENQGVLEVFGPNSQPWRVASEDYLKPAIALASTDSRAALQLAPELVAKEGIGGIVRFRCSVPVQVLA